MWRSWVLAVLAPAAAAAAITGVDDRQTTATQALISYTAPNSQPCAVEISESPGYVPLVDDVNPALFPGSNLDSRPGSVWNENGRRRTFVAGKRTAEKAVDNRYYSRALQANTKHYYRIRCGAETYESPRPFLTMNPPLGNTAGEVYPVDTPGQYAWPTFDYTDPAKWYIDPLTGIAVKPASWPWQTFLMKTAQQAAAAYGQAWTAPESAAAVDGVFAYYSGAAHDPLFIQLGMAPEAAKTIANVTNNGSGGVRVTAPGHGYATGNTVVIAGVPEPSGVNGYWKITAIDSDNFDLKNSAAPGDLPASGGTARRLTQQMTLGTNHSSQLSWNNSGFTTDMADLQVSLTGFCDSDACKASDAERRVEVCLTVDAVKCASDWKQVTLPASNGAVSYPAAFPNAGLQSAWLGGAFQTAVPAQDIQERTGTVTVSGTSVTLATGDPFNADRWTTGSLIYINGETCRIESVQDRSHLTLSSPCGGTGWYEANNFGVLVRKVSATAGTSIAIDGATYKAAGAQQFTNGASGAEFPCINSSFTDYAGKTGFVCQMGSQKVVFITTEGDVRPLGNFGVQWHQAGPTSASIGFYEGESQDRQHPVWYVIAGDDDRIHTHLFKAIYHSDGRTGCSDPTGFRSPANLSTGSCLIEWQDVTKDLYGGDLELDPTLAAHASAMAAPSLVGTIGRYGAVYRSVANDCPGWLTIRDLKTLQWTGAVSSYSQYPFRWCSNHSQANFQGSRPYWGLTMIEQIYNCTLSGAWSVKTVSSIGISQRDSCDAITDPKWRAMGEKNGCAVVQVAGEPCKASPTAWESANLPACSWDASQRRLQDVAEGDHVGIDSERFVVGKVLSPTRWLLVRNYNPGCNALRNETTNSVYGDHAAGATATMKCSAVCRAGTQAYVDLSNPSPSARIFDLATSPTGHSDSALDAMIRGWQNQKRNWTNEYTARYGDLATASALPATIEVDMSASFAGARGLGQSMYVQSHLSHRQILAEDKKWITDFNPLGPNAGQGISLWAHGAARVSGDLLKLNTTVTLPNRKKVPGFGYAGKWVLKDISGPGSAITGGSADAWKMCVADFAGECVSGSQPGQVYMNVPRADLTPSTCQRTFAYRSPCFAQASWDLGFLSQVWLERTARNLSSGRHLTAGFQSYGATMTYANGKALPDGSHILLNGDYINGVRSDLLLAKVPPKPSEDSTNRTTFVALERQVNSAPAGTSTAAIEFGYDPEFRCTSRSEACVATEPALNEAAPFWYASEQYAGAACANGCRITIPAVPQRVVYYRFLYRKADGAVLARGATMVAAAQ